MEIQIYDFYNKFGPTHKSVGIGEYVDFALHRNANTIGVISSGNLYMALREELNKKVKGMNLVNLINETYSDTKQSIPISHNRILRDAAEREEYLQEVSNAKNLNLGTIVDVTDFIPNQYSIEAKNIIANNPDYVAVPIGSGKLFLSIYNAIKQEGKETKLIGFLPKGENGIFVKNQFENEGKLYCGMFCPKNPADKLVTPYVLESYRQKILQAQKEGHLLVEFSCEDAQKALHVANKYVAESEYSSASAFLVCTKKFQKKYLLPKNSDIVVVNTGKGTKEQDVVIYRYGVKYHITQKELLLDLGCINNDFRQSFTKRWL